MRLRNGNSYEFRWEKHGNDISPEARIYGSVFPSITTTRCSARFDYCDGGVIGVRARAQLHTLRLGARIYSDSY